MELSATVCSCQWDFGFKLNSTPHYLPYFQPLQGFCQNKNSNPTKNYFVACSNRVTLLTHCLKALNFHSRAYFHLFPSTLSVLLWTKVSFWIIYQQLLKRSYFVGQHPQTVSRMFLKGNESRPIIRDKKTLIYCHISNLTFMGWTDRMPLNFRRACYLLFIYQSYLNEQLSASANKGLMGCCFFTAFLAFLIGIIWALCLTSKHPQDSIKAFKLDCSCTQTTVW